MKFQIYRKWRDTWQACGGIVADSAEHALDLIVARDKRFPRWLYRVTPIRAR